MEKSVATALFVMFAAAVPGDAPSQTGPQQAQPPASGSSLSSASASRPRNLYRGSKIIGAVIRDPRDRKLGRIADIVLDSERGEVAYVVMSFGGALGSGNRYRAIPWKALKAGDDGKYYVLHADREVVGNAPSFDRAKWPDLADPKWSAEVDRYWDRMVGSASSDGISTSSGANTASGGKSAADASGDARR